MKTEVIKTKKYDIVYQVEGVTIEIINDNNNGNIVPYLIAAYERTGRYTLGVVTSVESKG